MFWLKQSSWCEVLNQVWSIVKINWKSPVSILLMFCKQMLVICKTNSLLKKEMSKTKCYTSLMLFSWAIYPQVSPCGILQYTENDTSQCWNYLSYTFIHPWLLPTINFRNKRNCVVDNVSFPVKSQWKPPELSLCHGWWIK